MVDLKLDHSENVTAPVEDSLVTIVSPSNQTTVVVLKKAYQKENCSNKSRLQKTREAVNKKCQYLHLLVSKVLKVGPLVVNVFWSIIPVTLMVLGLIYMDDCPVDYKIPILFFVIGSCQLSVVWLRYFATLYEKKRGEENWFVKEAPFVRALIIMTEMGLCYFGFDWIIDAKEADFEDVSSPKYCDRTFHTIAFWFFMIRMFGTVLHYCFDFCSIMSTRLQKRKENKRKQFLLVED